MVTHDIKSARRGNRSLYLKDGSIYGECELSKYYNIGVDNTAFIKYIDQRAIQWKYRSQS